MSQSIYESDKRSKNGYDNFLNFVDSLKIVPCQLYSAHKSKENFKKTYFTTDFRRKILNIQGKPNLNQKSPMNLPSIYSNQNIKLNKSKSFGKLKTPIKIKPSAMIGLNQSQNQHYTIEKKSLFNKEDKPSPMTVLNKIERAAIIIQKYIRRYIARRQIVKIMNNKILIKSKPRNILRIPNKNNNKNKLNTNNKRNSKSHCRNKTNQNSYSDSKSFHSEISSYSLNTNSIDLSSEGDSIELL